jgi:hypothetical protein
MRSEARGRPQWGFRAPCQFGATCARHAVGPSQFAPDRGAEVVNNADSRFYEVRYDGEAAGILVCEEVGSRRVLTHTTVRTVIFEPLASRSSRA